MGLGHLLSETITIVSKNLLKVKKQKYEEV